MVVSMTETKKREPKVKSIDLYKQELQMYEQMPEQIKVIKGWTQTELEQAIADLTQKITLSKRGKSSRVKGASYENTVAKKFAEKWGIRLVRTPMSGGFQKSSDNESIRGDLSCLEKNTFFKLSPECKNQKTWKLREWYKQSREDCPPGKVPLVIFHQSQENKDGKRAIEAEDFVMISLSDFLDLTDQNKAVIRTKEGVTRNAKVRRPISGSKGIKRNAPRKRLPTLQKKN